MMEFNWNEFLLNLLYLCLTCIVPVLVKYLIAYLNAKLKKYTESIESNQAVEYVYMAVNMIEKIVTEVSQTYVDELKAKGEFNAVNQKIAKDAALSKANELIADETKSIIEKMYGDFQTWASTVIEASIREKKGA